ncbi:hypothetical protein [Gracilimonas mengyeensis]|uniref:Uncharacterized protein n=1 Tax=Gracilimonas mengyeensis TaxID=1302730 RepID=A0A521BJK8_9BACT|nr:hypothetical protein [Gracilimonas mengyeensis]SMO47246.1 hypothetical protein SAMN06265219_102327 [Gracilimonas mengyeensis]
MNTKTIGGFLILLITLSACGTPYQVKKLSVKQNDYLDAAIEATAIQSEALVLASEKLVLQATERIDQLAKEDTERFSTLLADETLSAEEVSQALTQYAASMETANRNKIKLLEDLATIREQSQELQEYLKQLKQVHVALDAYIQSEKAGEAVVNDVLNLPGIEALVQQMNNRIPTLTNGLNQLNQTIESLGVTND